MTKKLHYTQKEIMISDIKYVYTHHQFFHGMDWYATALINREHHIHGFGRSPEAALKEMLKEVSLKAKMLEDVKPAP